MAGLNAALAAAGSGPFVFDRATAYIGVLIDDLITHGVDEPYRMFTSRAEYRLTLRADNADQRLTPAGVSVGCVGTERALAFEDKLGALAAARALAGRLQATPDVLLRHGMRVNRDGVRRRALDLLAYPEVDIARLCTVWPELAGIDRVIVEQLEIEACYIAYLERQDGDIRAFRRDEALVLPRDLPYDTIDGLSNEVREKLSRGRPATLGQAARIAGVTPAGLTTLLRYVRRERSAPRRAAAG